MKKFKFKKTQVYKKGCNTFYKSNKQKILEFHKKYFCQANIHSGVLGSSTAYADIYFWSEFFTGCKFGYYLYRHFSGNNCYKQAEKWCNFLLNNPPYGRGGYEIDDN